MVKRHFKDKICPNCGFRFHTASQQYSYCPDCGQENYDLNAPISHLLKEAAENIFHFDTRSVRTIKTLVFNPGTLTSEYVRGKRAHYVKPIRLYIFISFIFFLILSLSSGRRSFDQNTESISQTSKSHHFSITFFGLKSAELYGIRESQLDSVMQAYNISATAINRYIIKQMARIGSGEESSFSHLMTKNVSYMMFILMPFFALLVYLFFRKQAHYYIGTLAFSLHYHSFAFLLLSFLLLLSKIPMMSLILLLAPIFLAVYLFISLRTVYRQSRIVILLKTAVIGILHILSLVLLFLLTVFTSLLIF